MFEKKARRTQAIFVTFSALRGRFTEAVGTRIGANQLKKLPFQGQKIEAGKRVTTKPVRDRAVRLSDKEIAKGTVLSALGLIPRFKRLSQPLTLNEEDHDKFCPCAGFLPLQLICYCHSRGELGAVIAATIRPMFVRFRHTEAWLQLSLVEINGDGDAARQEDVASLGAIPIESSAADRAAF